MKIGIFGSLYQKEQQIKKILDTLSENHVEIYIQKKFNEYLTSEFNIKNDIAGLIEDEEFSVDFAFSIGGDGTFLQTASAVGNKGIPVLGINTGRMGFLADISENELDETLEELLKGEYRIENRSQLALFTVENSIFENSGNALNEVAVLKQDTSSMLTIHACTNGEYLMSYQADGLIVATPTGSTAYSLSVGGPILTPDSPSIVLTAVAPHSLNTRPLVIKDDCVVTLEIESRNKTFLVSLDGRSKVLSTGIKLEITKSDYTLKVVKRIGHTFYETLRKKLMLGADARSGLS